MGQRYEIYADEAWTHGGEPLHRYWCFYGGLFGSESALSRLDAALRGCAATHQITGEVKWQKLTPHNLNRYKAFVDCALAAIATDSIRYRQLLCDRAYVRVADPFEPAISDLDVQFKLCYQFIKHTFGLRYLDPADDHEVLVRLDTHSSQKHKDRLVSYVQDLPGVLGHGRLSVRTTFHQSDLVPRIQVCDLIIGAAGHHGNRQHEVRRPGQRGMSPKQRARKELAKHIYDGLRQIDAADRGSRVFHWFESTGFNGGRENLLNHKIRIWKFIPTRYRIDAGWQNDNLGAGGTYGGRNLIPQVQSVRGDGDEEFRIE